MGPITNSNTVEMMHPHSPYIYKAKYHFNWEELKPLCEAMVLDEHQVDILKNGKSSYTCPIQPHSHPAFADFYQWLTNIVMTIGDKGMGLAFMDKISIANSWVNVQEYDGYTTEHNHAHSTIGVAAYLYMPENGGYFECKDPLELIKSGQYHNNPDWAWKEIPTITGDILIFPAWLIHRTQKNSSNEGRWVLTTNFIQKFD